MKSDLSRSGLYGPWLAGFSEQVIHIATHSKWGQLWMTGHFYSQNPKKNRDLSRSGVLVRHWLFFNQKLTSHVLHGVQGMANTLSTEAPTDFGGNFTGSVENR
jgi:hypothetical protein